MNAATSVFLASALFATVTAVGGTTLADCDVRREQAGTEYEKAVAYVQCVEDMAKEDASRLAGAKLIEEFGLYDKNSVGGIRPYARVVNVWPDRRIKYVTLEISMMNAVGDRIASRIGGLRLARVQIVGPLEPGEEVTIAWDPVWYNKTAQCLRLDSVSVEFMSGPREHYSGRRLDLAASPAGKTDCGRPWNPPNIGS